MNDAAKTEATEATTESRVRELCYALRAHDHGDGCLGIIVRQALADNPDVTVDEIREICREAESDAEVA